MVEAGLEKTMPEVGTVTVAAVAMSAALLLVWCVAVGGHLCLLRSYYAG